MAAITTRAAKGAPLTNAEVDANFTNLNNDKVETSAVGTIAAQDASSVAITGGSITGITDLTVADGGTGRSSLTAENVLLGDGTSPVKFVAPGALGNVLTSNGTTWASAAPAASSAGWTLLDSKAASGTLSFTDIPGTYTQIMFFFNGVSGSVATQSMTMALSTDNGSTYGTAQSITIAMSNVLIVYGYFELRHYAVANTIKIGTGAMFFTTNSTNLVAAPPGQNLSSTAIGAVNAIRLGWTSGSFDAGTVSLYGI